MLFLNKYCLWEYLLFFDPFPTVQCLFSFIEFLRSFFPPIFPRSFEWNVFGSLLPLLLIGSVILVPTRLFLVGRVCVGAASERMDFYLFPDVFPPAPPVVVYSRHPVTNPEFIFSEGVINCRSLSRPRLCLFSLLPTSVVLILTASPLLASPPTRSGPPPRVVGINTGVISQALTHSSYFCWQVSPFPLDVLARQVRRRRLFLQSINGVLSLQNGAEASKAKGLRGTWISYHYRPCSSTFPSSSTCSEQLRVLLIKISAMTVCRELKNNKNRKVNYRGN